MIAKLERVPLREVWKHEAYDFTQWLEENIDILSEVIDLTLVNAEREKKRKEKEAEEEARRRHLLRRQFRDAYSQLRCAPEH